MCVYMCTHIIEICDVEYTNITNQIYVEDKTEKALIVQSWLLDMLRLQLISGPSKPNITL